MKIRFFIVAALAILPASQAVAQFTSDYPGVPRASISISGSKQDRFAVAFAGYKVPPTASGSSLGDTTAGSIRIGFGESYRIRSQFEVGFDVTVAEGFIMQPPRPAGSTTSKGNETYARGVTGYALRIGAKFRPIVSLDPDGYGYELAIGGAFQPQLKPLYGYEKRGDSTRSGGQFNSDAVKSSTAFRQNPFASISSSTIIAAMGSYRSKRLSGDAALVSETVPDRSVLSDPSPLRTYDGISARVGGAFRLTPGFAIGGSYWGSGSPPWFDETRFDVPGGSKPEKGGLLLQFGSDPESGLDLMISSPTGKLSESLRIFIRTRST